MLNSLSKGNDLRSRLSKSKKGTQFRDAIQVVVTNTNITKSNSLKLNESEVMFVKKLILNYNLKFGLLINFSSIAKFWIPISYLHLSINH